MALLWLWLAVGAAILWGLAYAMSEHLLKQSVHPSVILFTYTVIGTLGYGMYMYFFVPAPFTPLQQTGWSNLLWIALLYMVANFMVFTSISLVGSATLASLIEISYPLFTALFVWVLYKQNSLNLYTLLGALLMIVGVWFIQHFAPKP